MLAVPAPAPAPAPTQACAPASTPARLLDAALQEWPACCQALLSGRLILVARKGGIHEREGGGFTLAHQRFALLSSSAHQDAERLRPDIAALAAGAPQPPPAGTLTVAGWAQAEALWKVDDLARILALGAELAFTAAELEARFRYRAQPWLFVVALRVHRLDEVALIPDLPRHAGCVSWIDCAPGIDPTGSRAVLADQAFAARLDGISRILGSVPQADRAGSSRR